MTTYATLTCGLESPLKTVAGCGCTWPVELPKLYEDLPTCPECSRPSRILELLEAANAG